MVKAVFLDRDGVINKLVPRETGIFTAPWSLEEFELLPYVEESIDTLKKMGYMVFVVTNQPDHLDGKMSYETLETMSKIILDMGVNDIICALNRKSLNYKPNNGMVLTLIEDYDIDPKSSYLIGDRWKDIVCGARSNLTTIFIGDEYHSPEEYQHIFPDFSTQNILTAVNLIKELNND